MRVVYRVNKMKAPPEKLTSYMYVHTQNGAPLGSKVKLTSSTHMRSANGLSSKSIITFTV